MRDFQLEKFGDKDSEDYSELNDDDADNNGAYEQDTFEKEDNFGSPLRLKNAMTAENGEAPSAIKSRPDGAEVDNVVSSEIEEEDYEI